jgi:hypothetical protein
MISSAVALFILTFVFLAGLSYKRLVEEQRDYSQAVHTGFVGKFDHELAEVAQQLLAGRRLKANLEASARRNRARGVITVYPA